jgi:hypothetical protein
VLGDDDWLAQRAIERFADMVLGLTHRQHDVGQGNPRFRVGISKIIWRRLRFPIGSGKSPDNILGKNGESPGPLRVSVDSRSGRDGIAALGRGP